MSQTEFGKSTTAFHPVGDPSYNSQLDYMFPNLGSFINNRFSGSGGDVLCGQPGFCDDGIYLKCTDIPIQECELCHMGLAVTFIFFAICLGLAIIFGNVLILLVGYRRHKHGKSDNIDHWKSSLAIAGAKPF